jgi:hypothetical protein
MTSKDDRWSEVEVAVSQDANEPAGFRVVFERSAGAGKSRLATVYFEGGDPPAVTRFARAVIAEAAGLARANFEQTAVAVVGNLTDALAWD